MMGGLLCASTPTPVERPPTEQSTLQQVDTVPSDQARQRRADCPHACTGAAYAAVQQLAGDPSQWGIESVAKRGSFDITEAEGSEELLAASGTDKGGDVPVVTG